MEKNLKTEILEELLENVKVEKRLYAFHRAKALAIEYGKLWKHLEEEANLDYKEAADADANPDDDVWKRIDEELGGQGRAAGSLEAQAHMKMENANFYKAAYYFQCEQAEFHFAKLRTHDEFKDFRAYYGFNE
jgi:hypothetical protein